MLLLAEGGKVYRVLLSLLLMFLDQHRSKRKHVAVWSFAKYYVAEFSPYTSYLRSELNLSAC